MTQGRLGELDSPSRFSIAFCHDAVQTSSPGSKCTTFGGGLIDGILRREYRAGNPSKV